MSGIAGWLDWERDLQQHRPTVAHLGSALFTRASGTARTLLLEHVALVQRASIANEPPTVARDHAGEPVAVAICEGNLLNAEELTAIGGDGFVVTGGGKASEAVLRAYLRWGRSAPAHLEGEFAFGVWDVRRRELLLGRDRLGVKPLSYFPTPAGVVFASDVATVAGHPLVPTDLDGNGLSAVLTQLRSPGHGVFRGMREVRPGHTVCFAPDGRTELRYWALEARPHELDLDATITRVREILEGSIERVTAGAGARSGVLLSGGLDSSVLTGLVASASGSGPRTFTVRFGDSAAAVPDRPFAEEVVRLWNCDHREITVRAEDLLDPVTLAEVLSAKDYPTPFGDKNITPYVFSRRVARDVPMVLSGEGADILFGGPIDSERRLTSFPWIERTRRFGMPHGIGTGLFDQALLRNIDIDGHLDRMFREAMDEVPQLPGAGAGDRLARQVDYLTVTRQVEQGVLHSERLSTAAGLQMRFPFLDHRLLSFLYNVPVALKSFDGREKSLLRAIGRELVPQSVLARAKVPFPVTYDPVYKAGLVRRLRALLEDGSSPVRPLVNLTGIRRTADDPTLLDRGGWLGRADAETVLHLDGWMRRLQVRVRL